jgi:hypothetical protein
MAERQRRGKRPVTTTRKDAAPLDPEEERVVRARHGYRLPDDVPLGSKAGGNDAVAAQLREIERKAFEQSGRLAAMKAEAEADEQAEAKKAKIVSGLKRKSARKSKKP